MEQQQEKLRNVSTKEIKNELNQLGISTQSYYERSELVKLLAETRAERLGMDGKSATTSNDRSYNPWQQWSYNEKNKQVQEDPGKKQADGGRKNSSSSSSGRLKSIDEEMDYIRRVMNFEDIKFELSAFRLSTDGLTYDEAVYALALSRLRIEPVDCDIDEVRLVDDFLRSVKNTVNASKSSVQSFLNGSIKSVKMVAKNYESGGYTSAEKDAMDVLNGKIPKENFVSNFHSRSSWSIPADDYDTKAPTVSHDDGDNDNDRHVIGSDADNYNTVGSRGKRKKTKVRYVTDNINRDIWTAYFQKLRDFLSPIINIRLGLDAIRVFLTTGIEIAVRMGVWSGGSDLTPSQSLFVACIICIFFRRGILTFIGTLVSIRLLRIAFLGVDNARETLDDNIDSRGDNTNGANVAY